MLISKKQTVEDIIVEILAKTPYTEGPALVSLIQKSRAKTTKQAVYAALKLLIDSETVAKVAGTYFLSQIWLSKMNRLFQSKNQLSRDAIFDLKEMESISYHFPSLLSSDTYWAHVFNLLIEWIPVDRPIFVWNPHEWFAIARKDVETNILKEFQSKNKKSYYVIRGKTALDKEFKKTWSNSHVSISIDEQFPFEDTHYINIFDDFIIEVFIDQELADKIEKFYGTHTKLTAENTREFESLIEQKYPVRMKISKKKDKAAQLRKKFSKQFFIPKELNMD